ncbi:MAG: sigma-54 dependent transcriptional regulator [Pseudomonadota bacterium]
MIILIVDDDQTQREMLQGFLAKQGFPTRTASCGSEALAIFRQEPVELVLLDNRMPGMSGGEILEEMKALDPRVHAIMITAYGDIDTVVKVMKLGAVEFFEKPVNLSTLLARIQEIQQKRAQDRDVEAMQEGLDNSPLPLKIVAESDAMKEVLSLVRRMAASQWPVLVTGETGTGKELISKLIHLMSDRNNSQFVDVNCAAIPENLFESELFGHVKGAYTGAVSHRRGSFELASGGSLLLDEIGEMPMALQPKLLRTIQEHKIRKVGSETDLPVDVRLISATNRDLKKQVEQGAFREDLYYRIRVLEIEIPPLRHRRMDIPPLVEVFLERCGNPPMTFSQEALSALVKYPFPGNVRELEHIVQRTVTLARGSQIQVRDLPQEVLHHGDMVQGTLDEQLKTLEARMIRSALDKSDWVQTRAAEILGISERVLRYKMKRAGIANDKRG